MPDFSLVVRNGTVVDGSGLPSYRADVGVQGDRIAAIGRINERGAEEIDADGHLVTPGFVDGHTHMDAQIFWDPLGTCSCWHGVTTAVMGNCGFTLAPARRGAEALVIRNLERAEDIPAEAMAAGVTFTWERYREYLDAVDAAPKGINYAGYVGHSALRTWAMGERAFDEAASPDDLALMVDELRDALSAGAVGFTTSRTHNHWTSDGRPVASRVAEWSELVALVAAMGDAGGGIFELSNESAMASPDPATRAEYAGRLHDLAVMTGVPTTFGVTSFGDPNRWKELLDVIDAVARDGGQMFGQATGKESGVLFSFKTWLPFDKMPVWSDVRRMPLEEQAAALRRPEIRQKLVEAAREGTYQLGNESPRPPDYDRLYVMERTVGDNPTLAAVAKEREVHPAEAVIDLGLETNFEQFFTQVTGNANPVEVQSILQHPRTVMTFSDAGAHVSQIINPLQTHLLAYWVREREVFTWEEGVRMITFEPASAWNIPDRGLIREGFVADLNIVDPGTVAPEMPTVTDDLPAGAVRLHQKSSGILATVVAGEVVFRDGEHTGALPGRLLRRRSS